MLLVQQPGDKGPDDDCRYRWCSVWDFNAPPIFVEFPGGSKVAFSLRPVKLSSAQGITYGPKCSTTSPFVLNPLFTNRV